MNRTRSNVNKVRLSDYQKNSSSTSGPEQRIGTSFSIAFLHGILTDISEEKQEIINSIGLGILLKVLTTTKFPRQLAFWVLRNMSSKNGEIKVKDGVRLMAKESDVQLVLGIPRGNRMIITECNATEIEMTRIRKLLMLKDDAEITMECVEKILRRDYGRNMSSRERDAFIVAFVLCADAYFLGPKGGKPKINTEMFINLIDTKHIAELNWCGYVLKTLIQSAKRIQQSIEAGNKTVTLDGCLLFPVVREYEIKKGQQFHR